MLLGTLTAQCQESRFYVKGDLGGNLTSDTDATVRYNSSSPPIGTQNIGWKARFDPGWRVGLAGGYQLTDWFAVEAELGAIVNRMESVNTSSAPGVGVIDGTFASVPFLFNVRLQYPNRSHWTPYIGAGVGVSAAILDADILVAGTVFNTYQRLPTTSVDAALAYQAFAGLRYRLNERMGVSLEYRYLVTESPGWNLDCSCGSVTFGRIETHAFSLAFEYRF
jgi:opacity protein-like surface antigen